MFCFQFSSIVIKMIIEVDNHIDNTELLLVY